MEKEIDFFKQTQTAKINTDYLKEDSLVTIVQKRPKLKKFLKLGGVALMATSTASAIIQNLGLDSLAPLQLGVLLGSIFWQLSKPKPSFSMTALYALGGFAFMATDHRFASEPVVMQLGAFAALTGMTMLAQQVSIKKEYKKAVVNKKISFF